MLKAASAGDQKGKPPAGYHSGKGEPATKRARPPPGTANSRRASAAPRPAPGDARGEAPCIKKLKISPFPGGEGGQGDGARKQAKGRIGRRQRGHAPPPGTAAAVSVRAVNGLMPGRRERSPRQNKLIVSPFPLGRGLGGWGRESKLKAASAGDKDGTPPAGYHSGRGEAATKRARPRRIS